MHIDGLTENQRQIADRLWKCNTIDEVNAQILFEGHDGKLVKELIILAAIDDQTATYESFDEVLDYLEKYQ